MLWADGALHTQSLESRSQLLEQLLDEEIVMAERDKEQGDTKSASTPLCTTLLRQIDTNLNFSEIVLKPTTVLGYKADTDLISSILGLLVTGCLLAFQGFPEAASRTQALAGLSTSGLATFLNSTQSNLLRRCSKESPECDSGLSGQSTAGRHSRIFDSQQEISNHHTREHDSDVVDDRIQVNTYCWNSVQ